MSGYHETQRHRREALEEFLTTGRATLEGLNDANRAHQEGEAAQAAQAFAAAGVPLTDDVRKAFVIGLTWATGELASHALKDRSKCGPGHILALMGLAALVHDGGRR